MSAVSSASYTLPAARPWHYARFDGESDWVEGKSVRGHPNICPLVEFFEDHHYYYLILPYTIPDSNPDFHGEVGDPPPKDLFDLVEVYPLGLPPFLIRSYLGQIADALAFLHMKGIGKFNIYFYEGYMASSCYYSPSRY
jgi:protein-serine/threonine kinase